MDAQVASLTILVDEHDKLTANRAKWKSEEKALKTDIHSLRKLVTYLQQPACNMRCKEITESLTKLHIRILHSEILRRLQPEKAEKMVGPIPNYLKGAKNIGTANSSNTTTKPDKSKLPTTTVKSTNKRRQSIPVKQPVTGEQANAKPAKAAHKTFGAPSKQKR